MSGVQEPEANTHVAPGEGNGIQRPVFVGKMVAMSAESTVEGTDGLASLGPPLTLATQSGMVARGLPMEVKCLLTLLPLEKLMPASANLPLLPDPTRRTPAAMVLSSVSSSLKPPCNQQPLIQTMVFTGVLAQAQAWFWVLTWLWDVARLAPWFPDLCASGIGSVHSPARVSRVVLGKMGPYRCSISLVSDGFPALGH